MTWSLTPLIKKLWKYDSGVTAIEYALIAALIAIVIVASLTLVGTDLGTMIDNFSKRILRDGDSGGILSMLLGAPEADAFMSLTMTQFIYIDHQTLTELVEKPVEAGKKPASELAPPAEETARQGSPSAVASFRYCGQLGWQ